MTESINPSSSIPNMSSTASGQSSAHTTPGTNNSALVATFSYLIKKLEDYLSPDDINKVKQAYRFADEMHLGQMRQSGEPYISHPLAVAEICADWKLDAQAMMAAFLHDVMEDQGVTKEELIQRFGAPVATLVDGLSKLDKLQFQNRVEAQAENFRKMLLAMAHDVRVIIVKLADRLHNMRTLGSMSMERKHRIALETMEVYVPIAHRLGLNNVYRELQDLAFSHLHPVRYNTLIKAVKAARGNRREVITKILEAVTSTLIAAGISARIDGREKTIFGIYSKMRRKHLTFSQVLDIYGFRVIVDSFTDCYVALGTLHSLFKPMPGKFKDYIAIPKINGYQSLHTTLIGPYGTPIEFQIRTTEMHHVAESGVAAHWLYKDADNSLTDIQQRTHAWLQSLLDIQKQTGDSIEFLENVKVDLFPDAVYVFTPKSKIIALPRGATALDFAYTIHTDIGDQTTAAMINHEAMPLRTELHNGDIIEIITSSTSKPTPVWLSYVRTGKARSAIRHRLRTVSMDESQALGKYLLTTELSNLGFDGDMPDAMVERLLNESNAKSLKDIYVDIGIGQRVASLVARHMIRLLESNSNTAAQIHTMPHPEKEPDPVVITGTEGSSVQLAACCHPIPGDTLVGYLSQGQELTVHVDDCENVKRGRYKEPERWIKVVWKNDPTRRFECLITILMHNDKGSLAHIAAEISDADANIVSVAMDDDGDQQIKYLRFTIQVKDRIHLARVMRNIRQIPSVARILREKNSTKRDL